MMTNHKEHQTSNLLWFGDMPSAWKAKRFKYLTQPRKELSKTGGEELLSVTEVRGIVKRQELRSNDESLSRSENLTGYRHVKKGDLVSNIMLVWKRGLGVSPYDGIVSPAYSVFTFNDECYPDYYNYLVRSDEYITEFRKHSTGIRMSRLRLYDDSFGAVLAHLPPLEEQKLISRYLDKKTKQIDCLVEKIQKKIELLNAQRTSLINQCVTKGLDPNVEMKDSGLDWIEEIPKHWKISKVQYVSNRVGDGLHSTPQYVDHSEFRFINGNNLISGFIQYSDTTRYVSEEEYKKHFIPLNEFSLLLSINGTIGNVSLYKDEKIILGKSACYINFQSNIDVSFMFWLFNSESIQRYFLSKLTGTTIYNLSLDSVKRTPIVLPPKDEQSSIIKYLETQNLRSSEIIKKEKTRIKLLTEYRQSLISSVVTGKVLIKEDMI